MSQVTDYSKKPTDGKGDGKKIGRGIRALLVGLVSSVIVAITSRNDVLKDGKQKTSRGYRWFLNFGIISLCTFVLEFVIKRVNESDKGSIFNARLKRTPSEDIKQEMNAQAEELNRRG